MANDSSQGTGSDTLVGGNLETDEETIRALETLVGRSPETIDETEGFDPNLIFETLADPGHRYILTYLLQSDGAVTCGELVDYVTARTDSTMNSEVYRQRVVTELTNSYLPALDESGFLKYNMERQLVSPTELTQLARPYLFLALAQIESIEMDEER